MPPLHARATGRAVLFGEGTSSGHSALSSESEHSANDAAAFDALLQKLREEHDRQIRALRDELKVKVSRATEENKRLSDELRKIRRDVPESGEVDLGIDEPAQASSSSAALPRQVSGTAVPPPPPPAVDAPTSSRSRRPSQTSASGIGLGPSPLHSTSVLNISNRFWNAELPPSRWACTSTGAASVDGTKKVPSLTEFAVTLSAMSEQVTSREGPESEQSPVNRDGDEPIASQHLSMGARTRFRFMELAHTLSERTRCAQFIDKAEMISPVAPFRLSWDFFAFACLLVDLWITLFELVFLPASIVPRGFEIINTCITAFFVADILLNFNTGYIDRDKLVMVRSLAIKKYLTFWFGLDLLATVPWDILIEFFITTLNGGVFSLSRLARLTKIAKVLKTLRFLKFLRAIRLVQQMSRAQTFLDTFEPLKYGIRLLQILVSLAFLAHFHGCLWAMLQEDLTGSDNLGDAFHKYYLSFRWAYNAFTVGEFQAPDAINEDESIGVWTLDMIISSERILIALVVGGWGVVKALTVFQEDAQLTLVKTAAMRFFKQHEVSIQTQISVMYSLHETRAAQNMQRHFKSLMSEHLPDELRRTVSEELWVPYLDTLGLIRHMRQFNEDFVSELALVVREEVVASKTVLCREGHASIAAYYVIKGRLVVDSSHYRGTMPDFTDGMWVEETALLSTTRRRTATVVTPEFSRLMTVPSQSFHALITELSLEAKFQDFRDTLLARGLCGRCGSLGDHFTHACPEAEKTAQVRVPGPLRRRDRSRRQSKVDPSSRYATRTPSLQPDQDGGMPSLSAFLHSHRLTKLQQILMDNGVQNRAALEDVDFEELLRQAPDEGTRTQLSLLSTLVEEQREESRFNLSNEEALAQHLAFLSHYKQEAGTEAALMRAEIERVLPEEKIPTNLFNVPVFLDSEDLSDLEELQEHVRKSHNLVLLLTKGVLLRPWVLVEIVTAMESDVRVIPVEVSKKGSTFEFPDETFYQKLVAGKVLDAEGQNFLHERGIELPHIEKALRDVFMRIALPYSPHRSESIRKAEVKAIFKQFNIRGQQVQGNNGGPSRSRSKQDMQ